LITTAFSQWILGYEIGLVMFGKVLFSNFTNVMMYLVVAFSIGITSAIVFAVIYNSSSIQMICYFSILFGVIGLFSGDVVISLGSSCLIIGGLLYIIKSPVGIEALE